MKKIDKANNKINYLVKYAQATTDREERKKIVDEIIEMLKPFRYSLAKKFANKGVEFDDITQQIDLKLIEAIYDYNSKKDPSALRHLVSKARNGVWNYYRKEMNYFNDEKTTYSLDAMITNDELCVDHNYYSFVDEKYIFDENTIVHRIMLDEELSKLTQHQREILFMIYFDDMTQYSVAEELSINQANVSRAMNRGLENMRNNINPSGELDEID